MSVCTLPKDGTASMVIASWHRLALFCCRLPGRDR